MTKLQEAIEEQKRYYTVIVNRNRNKIGMVVKTKKELITIDKCKEICENILKNLHISVTEIKILMSEFDLESLTEEDYESVLSMDICAKTIVHKNAYYYPEENRLIIYKDGMPVYENYNGIICRDSYTLADCLC